MTTISGIHPHAECYPLLGEDELQALAADIAENGLRDPITVTPDGMLIDGRNRARACEIVGIEPETVVYEGSDIGAFVRSRNMRRHQSVGSLAMSTALSMARDNLRADGRWKRDAVAINGSVNSQSAWRQRIKEAGVVLDWLPDVAEQVVSGTLALDAAYAAAKTKRDAVDAEHRAKAIEAQRKREATIREKEANDRMLATLTAEHSKYLSHIESGDMSIKAAHAAHLADTEKERREQKEREMGWRDGCLSITESVYKLQGGQRAGEQYLSYFHPHERDYVPDNLQLTRTRVQAAIDTLTTILEGLHR